MRELIRHEKTFEWVQLRDEALLLLLYGAGLRINEALAFNGQDWTEDYLAVYGKGVSFDKSLFWSLFESRWLNIVMDVLIIPKGGIHCLWG